MTIPQWVPDAIFYQIFPDRFRNGNKDIDPPNVQTWGHPPDFQHYQGGDLRGIIQALDYLQELGINALYLNPIFLAPSVHRYNTTDYYTIDPILGNKDDLQELINEAHQRGIRIILDGVFNHTGRGFFAFNDIQENGENSPYLNWYHVKKLPLEAFSANPVANYEAWWGFKSLPKLNTETKAVREYIYDVLRYWTKMGIDGWRFDVPNEIDDDAFWADARRIILEINPEAYLLGEIWDINPRWVNDTHFDGLMNYPLRTAINSYLIENLDRDKFRDAYTKLLEAYPRENLWSMYNLLSSHDILRILTSYYRSVGKVQLAYSLIFSLPGAPAIYYGDEIGMEGEKDPDCRRSFNWEPQSWNVNLQQWIRDLCRVRNGNVVLRRGDIHFLPSIEKTSILAFTRESGDARILCVFNPTDHTQTISLEINQQVGQNLLKTSPQILVQDRLTKITLNRMESAFLELIN
ncbi:MAG TPA: glycoside hydrolase family 13 protein [Bellilinea sp.]|nr:glycoside hydrolase family 13 protein [Bellilinea sp.]